jgi:hypothetical protein
MESIQSAQKQSKEFISSSYKIAYQSLALYWQNGNDEASYRATGSKWLHWFWPLADETFGGICSTHPNPAARMNAAHRYQICLGSRQRTHMESMQSALLECQPLSLGLGSHMGCKLWQ